MKKVSIAAVAAGVLASLMLAPAAVAAPEKDTKYIDMQCGAELLTFTVAGSLRLWDQSGKGYVLQSITQTSELGGVTYGPYTRVLGGEKLTDRASVQCYSTHEFDLQGFTIKSLQLSMVPLPS